MRCFVLSSSASLPSPRPPGRLRLARGTGPGGDTLSFGDPSVMGTWGFTRSLGTKGASDAGAGGEQRDFGEPRAALRSTDGRDYSLSSLMPFHASNALLWPLLHQRYLFHRRRIKRALKSPSPGLLGAARDAQPPRSVPRPPTASAPVPRGDGQGLGLDPRDLSAGGGLWWQGGVWWRGGWWRELRRLGVSPRHFTSAGTSRDAAAPVG